MRITHWTFWLLLIASSLGTSPLALAKTQYVTDVFRINLRTGESTGHKIIKMLPSGTPVQVLQTNPDSGYTKVEIEGGTVGYVLSHQLMEQASARERLADLEAQLAELRQAPDKLASKLSLLQEQHSKLEILHQQGIDENRLLRQELESIKRVSADSLRIAEERDELRRNLLTLTRELEELKQKNRDLGAEKEQRWFLIGGGVLAAGIFLGLILPNIRLPKRRRSWSSL